MLSCINNGALKEVTLAVSGGRLGRPSSPSAMRGRKRHAVSRRIHHQHEDDGDDEDHDEEE